MSSPEPTRHTDGHRCDAIAIPNGDPHLRVELVSDTAMLAPVRGLVDALAMRIGFGDIDASHLSLAIDEVLANVMKHGYERRPDGRIDLRIWCLDGDRRGVLVVVEDHGRKVDPACFRSRDLDDLRPGGLGVHIIREVTDGCRFEQREGPGMRAVLVKWLPVAPGEAPHPTTGSDTPSKEDRP